MILWTILKRAWYICAFNGRFSLTKAETALMDAVIGKLPQEDANAFRTQVKSMEYLQRWHKGRVVYFWHGRYTGPLLSRRDTQCCVAQVSLKEAGKSTVANVVSIRGVLRMLQFRRTPGVSMTVESVVLYPQKYVDVEQAVHRSEHGKEDV